MENEVFSIRREDYLAHIDGKIEMYDLLLTALCEARSLLLAGKPYELLRTLNEYEHQSHDLFRSWNISDEYLESGQPDDLTCGDLIAHRSTDDDDARAFNGNAEAYKDDEDADISMSQAMLMAGQLTECASEILEVCEALLNAVGIS